MLLLLLIIIVIAVQEVELCRLTDLFPSPFVRRGDVSKLGFHCSERGSSPGGKNGGETFQERMKLGVK